MANFGQKDFENGNFLAIYTDLIVFLQFIFFPSF